MRIRAQEPKIEVCFMTSFITYYAALVEAYPGIDTKCFIKKPIESKEFLSDIREELGLDQD